MEANENIEKAKEDYLAGMKYKDIATKHDVSLSTVKSWKTRYKWNRKKGMHTRQKSTRTKSKSMHTKRLSNFQSTDDKWKEFCFLFLKYHNAAQAYAKVYDCSYQTALVNGSKLLGNTNINNYIEELRKTHSIENHADVNTVIQFYLSVLGNDISDYLEMHSHPFTRKNYNETKKTFEEDVDENGDTIIDYYTTISLKNPDKQDWSVIKSIHQGKDGLVLEPYDKMKAAKELINLLPQGKTSKQTDPVVQAIQKSAETGKESIDEDEIDE